MRRFELADGTSNKFWEVNREGASVTVRFGRKGSAGQTQTKPFADETKAKTELDKLVKKKLKKGYSEIGAPVASSKGPAETSAESTAEKASAKAVSGATSPKKGKGIAPPIADNTALPEGFLAAAKGYSLGIKDGHLVGRNPKGQTLASVPKDLKESELGVELLSVIEWVAAHERECLAWVDTWMLRSLPVPVTVITSVWQDESYRSALENLVVLAIDDQGNIDRERGGLLKGSDPQRGVGVVDREGETIWLTVEEIAIPHPILIDTLDDWRALATELSVSQGAAQLFRDVFARGNEIAKGSRSIDQYAGGSFKQLNHAIGAAKTLGYRVGGGSATARVLEAGKTVEARFWLGDEDPMSESVTGSLVWVDEKQVQLAVDDVPPIAFSEGMRMASAIYKKRVIEERKEES